MYGYISGTLIHLESITATVQIDGLGLGLDILLSPIALAKAEGKNIQLWIHHHKTEASEALFGFITPGERHIFRQLIKVNGIGGKTGLALLGLGEETLIRAIHLEDDKLLASVPGIGKKTAQKIIVDLKGSIDFSRAGEQSASNNIKNGSGNTIVLISSLVAMGYDKSRVESVVEGIDANLSLETRTVEAIRKLAQ